MALEGDYQRRAETVTLGPELERAAEATSPSAESAPGGDDVPGGVDLPDTSGSSAGRDAGGGEPDPAIDIALTGDDQPVRNDGDVPAVHHPVDEDTVTLPALGAAISTPAKEMASRPTEGTASRSAEGTTSAPAEGVTSTTAERVAGGPEEGAEPTPVEAETPGVPAAGSGTLIPAQGRGPGSATMTAALKTAAEGKVTAARKATAEGKATAAESGQVPGGDSEAGQAPAVAGEAGAAGRRDLVLWLHRGLTLVAVMGLVINTRSFWGTHALARPGLALTLTGAYLVMLVAAVLALVVNRQRSLARIDVGVLVTAIVIKVTAAWTGISGVKEIAVDEGILMDRAARGLAEGINPYTSAWDDILPGLPTQLMDGRGVFDFGYPPLGIQMGAGVQTLFPSLVGVVLVSWLALLATALILFFVAPRPLRPVATLGVLGLGTLTGYADNAYPSLISLPFLCLALWRWPSTGRGGRLGLPGYGRAVALGLACSIHQLGWFLALFLVVGLVMLRLGELPLARVFWLTMRFGGTALGVFFLVNLQFLIESPEQWLTGVFEPLLQHAVPHGQGLAGISAYLIGGSGALDFYGHATKALLVALLITFGVFLRRLGPAIAVLPWLIFMVSTRSQDGYWLLTMPLWIIALATTSRADFAGAFRIRALSWPPLVAVVGTAAVFLPAAGFVAVAVATPQPLTMRVANAVVPGHRLTELTVEVTNDSARAVIPSFSLAAGVTIADFWRIETGPLSLPAHTTATYTLLPPVRKTKDPVTPTVWADSMRPANPEPVTVWRVPEDGPVFLRAVSDAPQTMSSVLVIPDWPEEHEAPE